MNRVSRFRMHVLDRREEESFRRFVAASGGRTLGYIHESTDDICVSWIDGDERVDVSDFPTWRMI